VANGGSGPGGMDLATLGLEIDGSGVPKAIKDLDRLTESGSKAEAQAKKLKTASQQAARAHTDVARAVESETERMRRLAQQQQAVDAAFQNHLESLERREAQSQAERVAQSAQTGRQQARAQAEALRAEFEFQIANLKDAQARGFISPKEAAQAGREAGVAFNQNLTQVIDQAGQTGAFSGPEGQRAFTDIAGQFKNVDETSRRAGLGLGRLNNAMVTVARQAAGTDPIVGRLVDTVGTFAIGVGPMIPILAGLTAIAVGYRKITEDAREARREIEETGAELLEQARRRVEPFGLEREALDGQIQRIKELDQEVVRLQRNLESIGRPGGTVLTGVGTSTAAIEREIAAREAELGDTRLQRDQAAINLRERIIEQTRQALDQETERVQVLGELVSLSESAAELGIDRASATERAANLERQLRAIVSDETQSLQARVAAAEELAAIEERRQATARTALEQALSAGEAFTDAQRFGLVSIEDALDGLQDAERGLQDIIEDTNRELNDRVRARERELEVARQIERLQGQQAFRDRASSGTLPRREIDPRGGGQISVPDVEALNLFAGTDRALQLAIARFREMEQESDSLASKLDPALRGVSSVADAFGLLDSQARRAVRGVSDLIGGIQQIRAGNAAGGLAGALGAAGGVGAAIGGAVQLIGGLFGGGPSEEELEQLRLARERNRILERNADSVERLRRELEQPIQSLIRDVGAFIENIPERGGDDLLGSAGAGNLFEQLVRGQSLSSELTDLGAPSASEIERIADELGIDLFTENGQVISKTFEELAEAIGLALEQIERAELAFQKDIQVRRLLAKGAEEEAEALRRRLENEREIQDALARGFTQTTIERLEDIQVRRLLAEGAEEEAEALRRRLENEREIQDALARGFTQTTIERLEEIQALEEQARALEEARLREEERARLFADFAARGAALEGDDLEAARIRREAAAAEELRSLRELADAGTITAEELARFAGILQQELADAARKAAEQERRLARQRREDLERRRLAAQGLDDEAQIRRTEIEQQRELRNALAEGLPDSFIDSLREVQQLELDAVFRAIADAADEARRSLEEDLRVRELQARGLDNDAQKLRLQIEQERELQRLREEGIEDALLAELERVQDLEFQALVERLREQRREELVRQQTADPTTDFVRRSVSGITQIQADRMTDVLTSVSIWTRETAFNTRPLRGSGRLPVGEVGGRAPAGITVQRLEVLVQPGVDARSTATELRRELAREFGIEASRNARLSGTTRS